MNTYLSKEQIERLSNVFGNRQEYETKLKTLWALRKAVLEKMEWYDNGSKIDRESPLFQIANLTNELIGAIWDDSVYFVNNNIVKRSGRYDTDIEIY